MRDEGRALKAASSSPGNFRTLPSDVTSFVGRRREIADVKRLLSRSRILTLTGLGGVGKTRLAIRVADSVHGSYRDGVRLVECAELRDPHLLAHTTAEQLGLQDQCSGQVLERVIDYLRPRELLLVLDNCEHMIDECAQFVAALIRDCPALRILATSRQSLGVYGETVLQVAPLPVPDPEGVVTPESLVQCDSVRMFADRASAVIPDFDVLGQDCATLARLCRHLDGIPMAIELAAAWLRVLSLEDIDHRLAQRYRLLTGGPRGGPARQRTLRALIDWSYDLCSGAERRLWSCISVFSGSFDLPAAEYVGSGDGIAPRDVPDLVRALVDKSIVLPQDFNGSVRYRMLETMREYGQEQLTREEHAAVRRRHRDWCAEFVDRFDAEWLGPEQESWIRRLRREHANIRVALDFCVKQPGEGMAGLSMTTKLDDYWGIRGFHAEARHWLDQTLEACPEPTRERVSALRLDGWYALMQGDEDTGMSLLAEAGELAERLGCKAETASVSLVRGMMALFSGDTEKAQLLFKDALPLFREVHEKRGELFTLFVFGLTLGVAGDREQGLALLHACLDWTSQRGELFWRSYALWSICCVETLHGELAHAEEAGKEALRIHNRMGNRLGMAFVIDALAWVAERKGQHARAAVLFGAAAAIWEGIGACPDNFSTPVGVPHHQHEDRVRAAVGDDRYEALFERGHHLPEHQAIDCALQDPARSAPRDKKPGVPLTRREEQIASLVAQGMANKEIAALLVIAPRTVEVHVAHILSKLGFTSRAQIAAWTAVRQSPPLPTADGAPTGSAKSGTPRH